MSSCHLQHHCRHYHRPPLGDVKNLQDTRPSTENYRQIRMLRLVRAFPGEGHTNWLVNAKWSVLKTRLQPHTSIRIYIFILHLWMYMFTRIRVCADMQGHVVCVHAGALGQLLVLHLSCCPACF